MDAAASLMEQLAGSGLLIPSGVDGIVARSALFEAVVDALDAMAARMGAGDRPEVLRFPPAMVRPQLVRSGYLNSFPQLLGTIHCFCGNEAAHRRLLACVEEGKEWTDQQQPTDLLLTPAACYPLYPIIARIEYEAGFNRLTRGYAHAVRWTIGHSKLMLTLTAIVL